MRLSDEFWNQLDDESKTHLAGEPIPEDVRRAACMIHPYPVGWFDNPIPNFDGKSARHARASVPRNARFLLKSRPTLLIPGYFNEVRHV